MSRIRSPGSQIFDDSAPSDNALGLAHHLNGAGEIDRAEEPDPKPWNLTLRFVVVEIHLRRGPGALHSPNGLPFGPAGTTGDSNSGLNLETESRVRKVVDLRVPHGSA